MSKNWVIDQPKTKERRPSYTKNKSLETANPGGIVVRMTCGEQTIILQNSPKDKRRKLTSVSWDSPT